jgi:oxidase EvaA
VASAIDAADAAGVAGWLAEAADGVHVRRVPLHQLRGWTFDPLTGNLHHHTGRFFSIEAVDVHAPAGPVEAWAQPMINQCEVGILGLLVSRGRGGLRALVQRKVEPGNVNISQMSPTVQATHSNYTRVHGGTAPPYLQYFLDPSPGTVLVDGLQMEQAARYCGKRNRNMVVLVNEGDVPVLADYRWMPLAELMMLARCPNALNLDTRSVLSCLPAMCLEPGGDAGEDAPFAARALTSLTMSCTPSTRTGVREWLAGVEARHPMRVDRVPLRAAAGWDYDDEILGHESGRYFEVLGVSVEAPTREVPSWEQPLVRSCGRGVVGFLCQQQGPALRFLARGVREPGDPRAHIGPTVQCVPESHVAPPVFLEDLVQAPESWVRLRTVQSEEGGRFFHDERLLSVVEVPPDVAIDVPPDFRWLTGGELKDMIAGGGRVNIEARSLVACLPAGT